jgi:hypothetical protein
LVMTGSTRRVEVKLVEVGSRWGFGFATGAWPTMLALETGKKAAAESAYCCVDSVCTIDFFRDGETPELRTCATPAVVLSPQRARLRFQLSDSEDATREPEPVLPSMGLVDVPMYVLFSATCERQTSSQVWISVPRGRELSRALELKPMELALLFHMLPRQPRVECEVRSLSVPLMATPPVKSRVRGCDAGQSAASVIV